MLIGAFVVFQLQILNGIGYSIGEFTALEKTTTCAIENVQSKSNIKKKFFQAKI